MSNHDTTGSVSSPRVDHGDALPRSERDGSSGMGASTATPITNGAHRWALGANDNVPTHGSDCRCEPCAFDRYIDREFGVHAASVAGSPSSGEVEPSR